MTKPELYILSSIFILSCSLGTDPGNGKSPKDYTWSVDTLDHFNQFQSRMSSIWGSAADNVYVAGHHSGGRLGDMFHFNGTQWNAVDWVTDDAGFITGEMLGFGPDNIWICGDDYFKDSYKGYSIQFDGSQWNVISTPDKEGSLYTYGGEYPDNFWAGGSRLLLKYENGIWVDQPFDFPGVVEGKVIIRDIEGNNEHGLYFSLEVRDPSDISYFYLYKLNSGQWHQILDSGPYIQYYKLWMDPDGLLYISGSIGYRLLNEQLVSLGIENEFFVRDIYGTSENNIFATGVYRDTSKFYHYNGRDWYHFQELATTDLIWPSGVWAADNEVFFMGYTENYRTVIYHGK